MTALRSFVAGRWHAPESGRPIFDPSTEEPIAEVSTDGVDFAEVIAHAREVGGPALRATTFAKRAGMLRALSKALRAGRDELLELSRRNGGATTPDGAFDVDGGSGTLAYYGNVALGFGERASLLDGEGIRLWRDDSFHGRHLWVPRRGVALAINAFNFPVWGFAEKAACALAAGVPMIVKPATATALVAQRAVEMALEAGVLPEGALQLVCGSTGDLIDRLGPQDVLAFTGSAATAATLRDRGALRRHNTRVNVEADSLNAAVLAPGVEVESEVWTTFLKDVVREMRQKTGQKCTAVRRILVPRDALDAVSEALEAALADIVVGDPSEETVTMGPLASAGQLADAEHGVAELREVATLVRGGARVDGVGADPGRGYFFAPTLLRVDDAHAAEVVHEREVFAP
ncbi:MAG: 3,4-dehydroadipyl-CoA semialdehyde dehydrogenase, partial [Acidobacteriota bacterium]